MITSKFNSGVPDSSSAQFTVPHFPEAGLHTQAEKLSLRFINKLLPLLKMSPVVVMVVSDHDVIFRFTESPLREFPACQP